MAGNALFGTLRANMAAFLIEKEQRADPVDDARDTGSTPLAYAHSR